MKEATDKHGLSRMALFWHSQNSVIHSEGQLRKPTHFLNDKGKSIEKVVSRTKKMKIEKNDQ